MTELEYLRDKILIISEFISNKYPDNRFIEQLKPLFLKAYEKKDLKALRIVSSDMNAWIKEFPKTYLEELEVIFAERFGENLSGDKITHAVIKQVLKKGKIESVEDYRIVHDYLNDISASDPYYNKIEVLENLLEQYIGDNKITHD